jgi:hypothetical protein
MSPTVISGPADKLRYTVVSSVNAHASAPSEASEIWPAGYTIAVVVVEVVVG